MTADTGNTLEDSLRNPLENPGAFLQALFEVAVDAASPATVLPRYLPEDTSGRAVVIGFGERPTTVIGFGERPTTMWMHGERPAVHPVHKGNPSVTSGGRSETRSSARGTSQLQPC